MKVFILDDFAGRVLVLSDLLSRLYGKVEITVADSKISALRELGKNKEFDIMFLDHDLEPEFMDSLEENTGWWVAKYIADSGVKSKEIIIHTMNHPGARQMSALLPEARIIPYTALITELEKMVKKSYEQKREL